jgi:hypothetical protein
MDLPHDVCLEIFSYLPTYPLTQFRVVSKATVEYAKVFKGSKTRIGSLKKWRACFPRATQANISGIQLCMNELKYLDNVKELDMSFCCPYVEMIRRFQISIKWFHLPGLKKLTISCNEHMTDEWLSQFTELEDLCIGHSREITGSGFRNMKLKRLSLNSMRRITDEALNGLQVEDLTIISNSRITDAGILSMPKLTKLYLCWMKRIKCHGFEALPLKQIFVSDLEVDAPVFRSFAHVPKIALSQCHFLDSGYGRWTQLRRLDVYDSSFEEIDELAKLVDLPHFVQVTLTRCQPVSKTLQEKLGAKLTLVLREKWP